MSSAEELRRAFDGGFARPSGRDAIETTALLAIRVGGDPYALRLSELSMVIADRPITRVPANSPFLVGLAGVRGAVVPVFDLGACLGYPPASGPLWIARSGPFGFAFEALDGHLRVASSEIRQQASSTDAHTNEVIQFAGQARSIVRLASVIETIVQKET